MRLGLTMAAGALALAPLVALAGQGAAQPMYISVNGQAVPVQGETHVVQTASGPMKVTSWSWSSGQAAHTAQGGSPSPAVMQQMQAMDAQMRAAQVQMMAMQQHMRRMMALQQAAFAGAMAASAQQNVMFAAPPQVIILVPAQPQVHQPRPQQAAPQRAPGVDI
jgi:hypothetical protein